MATYGVFGLGKSGAATVKYLLDRGDNVFAWDDNEAARNGIDCTEPDNWDWHKVDALVLSPGIPLTHPEPHYIVRKAHAAQKPIICDIELLFLDNQDANFVGVTGTNGKSTTTALLDHILKKAGYDVAVGGNLGTPVLSLGKHKYYVIETSSYQLDLIDKTRFDVAIWLNISPDHIDRHGSIGGYVKAKLRMFNNGTKIAIIGIDDEFSKPVSEKVPNALPITKYNHIGDFPNLPGVHNMQNINAAYESAKFLGVPHEKIIEAIHSFPGLEHRIEKVATINNVTYINDSKATNADSSAMALACFDEIYWILGGKPKEGGITSLGEFFPRIKKAYLIGAATDEFAQTLEGKVEFEKCGTLDKAVERAAKEAKSGVVLLSPACASFDQFKSFEERGNIFKTLVKKLNSV